MTVKTKQKTETRLMTGAEIVITALREQGVEVMFGYPGGAVLPIYDELFGLFPDTVFVSRTIITGIWVVFFHECQR